MAEERTLAGIFEEYDARVHSIANARAVADERGAAWRDRFRDLIRASVVPFLEKLATMAAPRDLSAVFRDVDYGDFPRVDFHVTRPSESPAVPSTLRVTVFCDASAPRISVDAWVYPGPSRSYDRVLDLAEPWGTTIETPVLAGLERLLGGGHGS